MHVVRVALCQVNTVVGDLDGNVERIIAMVREAEDAGCDLAVFPELAVTGYPPEDLLLKTGFVAANRRALDAVASATGTCAAAVGFVDAGRDLHNAAAICAGGEVVGVYRKRHLPNYAVFDEARYFAPGAGPFTLYEIAGVNTGLSICEDAWNPLGPIAEESAGGAELILNLNASPFYAGRLVERDRMLRTRAADAAVTIVYVNQVGAQDELVFDGGSMVVAPDGTVLARMPQFTEGVEVVDVEVEPVWRKRLLDPRGRPEGQRLDVVAVSPSTGRDRVEPGRAGTVAMELTQLEEVHAALVLGTRDYVEKNAFSDVVIGMSGGIDSSLVAAIAVEAVGADRVHGISMPSRYSSEGSKDDAAALAERLGIDFRTIAIEPAFVAMLDMLGPSLGEREPNLTEENLQSRIRGMLWMALSNEFGWLVLTAGNKSEMAVGYATLYGDTAGGFAVIKDVPKLLVYDLCREINRRAGREIIDEAVLTKPPSAELRADQRDDQSLPPYEILDPILAAYVEDDRTRAEIIATGADPELVDRIVRLVDRAEYKRRQTAPGPRVTAKAFGKDRRMPITNNYGS